MKSEMNQAMTEAGEIVSISFGALAILDEQGRIRFATPSAEHWLGRCVEELYGCAIQDMLPADEAAKFERARRRAESGSPASFGCGDAGEGRARECQVTKVDEQYFVSWRARSADGEAGDAGVGDGEAPGRAMPIMPGVTAKKAKSEAEERERKKAKALQAAEWIRPKELLSAIGDAIIAVGREGRVVYWNKGAEELLGWTAEEMIGKPLADRLPEEGRAALAEWGEKILEGKGYHGDWHAYRRDGSRVWMEVNVGRVMSRSGKPKFLLGVARDISQRKELEQELVALNNVLEERVNERMAVAEERARQLQVLAHQLTTTEQRERQRLAQVLHDDLQQLIVAARLKVGRLRHRIHSPFTLREVQQMDDFLVEALQECRNLTTEVNPQTLVEGGLRVALQSLARQKKEMYGLQVHIEAQSGAEPSSSELATLLYHCARELLFNIVKHAEVDEAWIVLRRTARDRLELQVRDSGKGFDMKGLGAPGESGRFGLFSVSNRLEAYDAHMEVESGEGKGTIVTIDAPAICLLKPDNGEEALGEGESEAFLSLGDVLAPDALREEQQPIIRVMLADDHRLMRECLAATLNDEPDIEIVCEADDGLSACELARQFHPEVILMDIGMPRMNGIEATHRILREQPEICVIVLSMHDRQDMEGAMREVGAAAYVNKSEPSEDLSTVIRRTYFEKRMAAADSTGGRG